MKLTAKKGFTLIEMLIVIVIIGVLAAALIPRLGSARGKANDTARKADLQQIATALIAYQMDQNEYPQQPVHFADTTTTQNGTNTISTLLIRGGLVSIPKDPAGALLSGGLTITTGGIAAKGQYVYTPVIKNGLASGGFVLMSVAETEGGANYVFCPGVTPIISGSAQISEGSGGIKTCKKITKAATCAGRTMAATGDVDCTYTGSSQLRYIYIY